MNTTNLIHLVIVIPCLNESQTISEVIDKIPTDIFGIKQIDVVVINDGSSDNSAEISRTKGAIVISHPTQMGVGSAFNTGLNQAIKFGADIMVNIDGDGQFDPADIPKLIQPILEGRADFVTASRFKDSELEPDMPWIKKCGNKGMAGLISVLTGHKFYDVTCGFRAYSKETMLQLNLIGKFTYTQESLLDLTFKGIKIEEIPIKVLGQRQYGNSRVTRSLWVYAVNSGKIILRAFRDYKPLRFFGFIAVISFILSLGLGIFFFVHYFSTGAFSGHLWAGFSSGFLLLFSILFFVTGLLADMFDRIRLNQEKLLYLEKKKVMNNQK